MKRLILFSATALLFCFPLFAQDTTAPGGTEGIDLWIEKHIVPILIVAVGIYELVARLFPTVKDISLVNKIMAGIQWVLDKFVPNKAKTVSGKPTEQTHVNVVDINKDKK